MLDFQGGAAVLGRGLVRCSTGSKIFNVHSRHQPGDRQPTGNDKRLLTVNFTAVELQMCYALYEVFMSLVVRLFVVSWETFTFFARPQA